MHINFLIRIAEHPLRADKSAVGAINRPLQPYARIAITRNPAAVQYRVPRLSEGKDDRMALALPHRGDKTELLEHA